MSIANPVTVHSFTTSLTDTSAAIHDLEAQVNGSAVIPHCLFVFYSPEYDDTAVHRFLQQRFPGVPVIGGSSGSGVMSQHGLGGDVSLGLLAICDPDGAYGAAATPLGTDPAGAAERALHEALQNADAVGELPELVWIFQHPGREEAVVEGLRRVVGDRCPIVGGSSARSTDVAAWRQLGPDGPHSRALVVCVLFSSGGLAVSYQGGFEPTGASGVVTKVGFEPPEGSFEDTMGGDTGGGVLMSNGGTAVSRHILEIDDEPAADVYHRWLAGAIPDEVLRAGGNVSLASASAPLGVVGGETAGITYYRVIHVNAISRNRGLRTFAAVAIGERLHAMRGSRRGLINRAARVAESAVAAAHGTGREPAGALMLYCVGCRMAVGDDIGDVVAAAHDGFAGLPFLGCFTAGEQGPAVGQNVHANLMISAVVLRR